MTRKKRVNAWATIQLPAARPVNERVIMSIQMLVDKPCAMAPTPDNNAVDATHRGADEGKDNHGLSTVAITDRTHKQIAYIRARRDNPLKNCVIA